MQHVMKLFVNRYRSDHSCATRSNPALLPTFPDRGATAHPSIPAITTIISIVNRYTQLTRNREPNGEASIALICLPLRDERERWVLSLVVYRVQELGYRTPKD